MMTVEEFHRNTIEECGEGCEECLALITHDLDQRAEIERLRAELETVLTAVDGFIEQQGKDHTEIERLKAEIDKLPYLSDYHDAVARAEKAEERGDYWQAKALEKRGTLAALEEDIVALRTMLTKADRRLTDLAQRCVEAEERFASFCAKVREYLDALQEFDPEKMQPAHWFNAAEAAIRAIVEEVKRG